MSIGFEYQFPAIRGLQAKKEYYITMCPLGLIPKIFQLSEDDLPPENRAQRILNKARIPEIKDYIITNPTDYVFSSLAASVDGEMQFIPISSNENIGKLVISMDAHVLINDGQHRKAAIEEAIKINPDLKNETISIVFFSDQGLEKSQQMFADLNKHAIKATKSIGILYDNRDNLSLLTKRIINAIPLLKIYTDKENDNLSKLSPKLFTLTNLHDSFNRTLNKRKGETISTDDEKFLIEYWTELCNTISEWKQVQEKKMSAADFRKYSTCAHGVVIAAFGVLGNYLFVNRSVKPLEYIEKLNEIEWDRSNLKDWNGRAVINGGKISKTENNIALTCNKIKMLVGIQLSEAEQQLESMLLLNSNGE
jgi:DNA sulfur modification protein DndB